MGIYSLALLCALAASDARQWTDSSGNYSLSATLVGFNDTIVVLENEKRDLLSIPIAKLSKEDQEYLKSKEATDAVGKQDDLSTWTTRRGLKVRGRVLEYVRKVVTIQQRFGKIYVNDHLFDNLPGIYREIVPQIVEHFEGIEIPDKKAFEAWARKVRGAPKSYTCDGVLMELENGDLYTVPFFLFSEEDLKVLQPGWESWLAVEKDGDARQRQAFELEVQARAYQQAQQAQQARQIMQLQLELQAYDAGLFDLWEVRLIPVSVPGIPQMVVVPGRNSREAAAEASKRYPGYMAAGPIAKVRRRN